MRILGWLLLLILIGAIAAAGGVAYIFYHYGSALPDYRTLATYDPPVVTRLYANDGHLLTEYASEKRVFVPIKNIPRAVINAFLAAEDKTFYKHHGVDVFGVVRALLTNFVNRHEGKHPKGASTITQQVAKNFLLTNEVSLERKIKEAILSMRIENAYSKDKILELYLNEIYLGGGSYGVAAAAMDYFNKSLDDLTIEEAAYLAALPKAPNNYNPVKQHEAAIGRRNWVIDRMREDGMVNYKDAEAAKQQPLVTQKRADESYRNAEYFAEEVRRSLIAKYGEAAAYKGGLTVHTTLDPALQDIATRSLRDGLQAIDKRKGWHGTVAQLRDLKQWQAGLKAIAKPAGAGDWQLAAILSFEKDFAVIGLANGKGAKILNNDMGWARAALKLGSVVLVAPLTAKDIAKDTPKDTKDKTVSTNTFTLKQIPKISGGIVVMDPHTGRVLAMTGGFSPEMSVFNRATQALRQPGSSFKPFVYLAALEKGFRPNTIIMDSPISYAMGQGQGTWSPGNYHDDYLGPTTVRVAIEKSRNIVTVRTADYIGMKQVVDLTERFGIMHNMPPVLAMALGAGETTVLKMVTAYAQVDNGGKKLEPTLIDRVQDKTGKTLYRHDARACAVCMQSTWANNIDVPALPDTRVQITHPWYAGQITSILQGVVQRGTAVSLKDLNRPLAGKTGTTNDSKDVWFVGMTPDLVVGTYVGYDNPKTLGKKETGASVALPIVKEFFTDALTDTPPVPFRVPPGLRQVRIHPRDGSLARASDKDAIWESFVPGTEPDPDAPQARQILGAGPFSIGALPQNNGAPNDLSAIVKEPVSSSEDDSADSVPDDGAISPEVMPHDATEPAAPASPASAPLHITPPRAAPPTPVDVLHGTGGLY